MFVVFTLPWYWKAFVVIYDVLRCVLFGDEGEFASTNVVDNMMRVLCLQTMIAALLLAPSLVHSVADRVKTNVFCSEMALLLGLYLLVVRLMRLGIVSAEHACFCLQFCSCYLFCCLKQATTRHRGLLVGSRFVKLASVACMVVFPVVYSHLLRDCMHVSPYALVFVFSGEVSGCVCACAAQLLVAFECLVDALYGRLTES
jgi:hypothetical protein